MAGHMGNVQVTTHGLEIVGIDKEKNLISIKGAVPGPMGSLVTVTKLGRIKGYTPPPEEKPDEEEEGEAKEATNEEVAEQVAENETPAVEAQVEEGEENANS